jgi:hypothetical protein
MKILLRLSLIALLSVTAHGANRFFINGGGALNWSLTANWSTTSGGAGGSAVPLSTDDVFFDGNSPSCTVNTTARVALSLTFTGYTNTITMDQGITVSGNVTLSSGMTIAGTSALTVGTTATLTSNGKTWPTQLILTGAATYTLADDWTVGQSGVANTQMIFGNTSANLNTVNGFSITPLGGVRYQGSTGGAIGTTVVHLTVTQTLDAPSIAGGRGVLLPMNINAPGGTITVSAGFPASFAGMNYIAGTVTTVAGTWTAVGGGGFRGAGYVK